MTRGKQPPLDLEDAIETLAKLYPVSRALTDPLSILVWENVGYLIDDGRRGALFVEFKERIGLAAREIANAPMRVLTDIAKRGGMAAQRRAERLKEIGALAIGECDGDIPRRLKALPLAKARSLLKRFPSVGEPGADRILLFSNIAPCPALDSNGLRTLVRMGLCAEEKSYGRTYRAAIAVLSQTGGSNAEWLKRAYIVLREHGKALCKRSAPICEPCPLDRTCAHRMTVAL